MRTIFVFLVATFPLTQMVDARDDPPASIESLKDLEELSMLTKVIAGKTNLTLFEGLPHQTWETELLEKELSAKKTVKQHKFPFYKKANKVSAADEKLLRKLCLKNGTFQPREGAKLCGGFHPDFSLHWSDGKETVEIQICFGCHEMRGYLGETFVYCDLTNEGFSSFRKILARYKIQRTKQ